ncbi:MAG: nucleoside triphosphate pyrophosphohydrolase [Spirochaetes bacterium GWF1_41_5]|nr:MAG: nucleoside triphosphate pyrophosphohydrolase [Spirochaetes bacterium GWF1_41_5]HBE03192.1 nucleoside triphosphate pyrophosphohydrolase [Spirochaetia bacterium]
MKFFRFLSALFQFGRLILIIRKLRGLGGCPWDQKQSFKSMRLNFLEEAYELAQAVDHENHIHIREEIGDLFLHLVFFSMLGEEKKAFSLSDTLHYINAKLIRRHPHVFSGLFLHDDGQILKNWEDIKSQEVQRSSVMSGVPQTLPPMIKACKIQSKASNVGFDWQHISGVLEKIREELSELEACLAPGNNDQENHRLYEETGDLLFSAVNLSRFLKIDPDSALESANNKFLRRFARVEILAREDGKKLTELDAMSLDLLWNRAKQQIRDVN